MDTIIHPLFAQEAGVRLTFSFAEEEPVEQHDDQRGQEPAQHGEKGTQQGQSKHVQTPPI